MYVVAGEPTSLVAHSNSTHVNITVSWESPATNVVTGYVIYYQSKGGPVISDMVSGGETETHSLDGLQRGVTYYISIVALSHHLPSPLVGPVTVIPGESLTSPSSHMLAVIQNCVFALLTQFQPPATHSAVLKPPSLLFPPA